MSLLLDDFINEYETAIVLDGKKYYLNCNLDTMLKYEKLLQNSISLSNSGKFKEEEFSNKLIDLIFGAEQKKELNELISKKCKSSNHAKMIWEKIFKYWMKECGLNQVEPNEQKKK